MRKQIISKQNGSFGILMSAECQLNAIDLNRSRDAVP